MFNSGKTISDLALAERMVSELAYPEWQATELAMRALTDLDVEAVLQSLCSGVVNYAELTKYLSPHRLEELVRTAEHWINTYACGMEIHTIVTHAGQLTSQEILSRYKNLISALESHSIVRVKPAAQSHNGTISISIATQ